MPKTVIQWTWEEAFDKFGFRDGDGLNETDTVAAFIQTQGWQVECQTWGLHNYMVIRLAKGDVVIEPDGYEEPRTYLPKDLISALDTEFPDDREIEE